LRAILPKLSDKVLSQRLRELEQAGLIERAQASRANAGSAYRLTELGDSLRNILLSLYDWGEKEAAAFGVTCGHPLIELEREPAREIQ
jgi:DNA-binding HxlR family transcriptional regulator